MELKLLCAADLHLGRYPTRIPPDATGDRLSGARAWDRLVGRALTERVDLVLLAGDIIDEANRSYEAWGPLHDGLQALGEAEIPVVAVAGNHDFETLPALSTEFGLDNLNVIGRGGRWERWTLRDTNNAPRLHVDGWSFPRKHFDEEPTRGYDLQTAADAPVVGLVHGDLDVSGSRYAPLRSAALRALPPSFWLLGHVHRPALNAENGAPILYPGSLQALDPGEPGMHGAWIASRGGSTGWSFDQIPLSATHYGTVSVPVDEIQDPGELATRVRASIRQHIQELMERDAGSLVAAWYRLQFSGRTALHDRLEQGLEGLDDFVPDPRITLITDPLIEFETRPAINLEDLARGNDPPARLARLLLALDGEDDLPPELHALARDAATDVSGQAHYSDARLARAAATEQEDALRQLLRRQASRLLDRLMHSREEP